MRARLNEEGRAERIRQKIEKFLLKNDKRWKRTEKRGVEGLNEVNGRLIYLLEDRIKELERKGEK